MSSDQAEDADLQDTSYNYKYIFKNIKRERERERDIPMYTYSLRQSRGWEVTVHQLVEEDLCPNDVVYVWVQLEQK